MKQPPPDDFDDSPWEAIIVLVLFLAIFLGGIAVYIVQNTPKP